VFDLYGNSKLAAWREFRDNLEESDCPFQEVVNLWNRAPFRSNYLDPDQPTDWPDPWNLVLNSDLDDLAISLGMLYTIKLTQRFNESKCEIHKDTSDDRYFVIVDDYYVLNYNYGEVGDLNAVDSFKTNLIWSMQDRI